MKWFIYTCLFFFLFYPNSAHSVDKESDGLILGRQWALTDLCYGVYNRPLRVEKTVALIFANVCSLSVGLMWTSMNGQLTGHTLYYNALGNGFGTGSILLFRF